MNVGQQCKEIIRIATLPIPFFISWIHLRRISHRSTDLCMMAHNLNINIILTQQNKNASFCLAFFLDKCDQTCCLLKLVDQQNYIALNLTHLNKKQSVMNSRKKPSVISEPTQPQRLKHFIRRNSIHTLHCRSGSLNKLTPYSEDLINLETNPEEIPEHPTKRRQTFDANARELINDLQDSPQISIKRASGSMQLRPCCRDKNKLIQKYQNLKKKYDKRGLQLNQLEHKCRELSKISHEEHSKRKKLQQELKLNKQELKRVQKRIEKYRIEKQEYQNEREIMSRHIDSIQKLKFNHSLVTVQNYREQILEKELEKVKEQLGKGRSGREEELLSEVHRLTDQKYNLEMLHSRTQVANNMLTKQLQQTEQYLQEMRQGIGQAVTTSVEYIQLRDRYRRTLLEMKDLRKEILQLERSEGSSILSISMLSASQSMRCQQ